MKESSFKLGYELSDYGKLKFEYDEVQNGLEMSSQRRKAMLKSPGFYYMMFLVLFLVVWFIASLISNSSKHGFLVSLGLHASGFFALFVMCLIVLLSAFGGWGRFMRWASGKKTDVKNFNKSENEIKDFYETKKNSIHIYEEWLVITNYGYTQVYYLDKVASVRLEPDNVFEDSLNAYFTSIDGEVAHACVRIPYEKTLFIQLKKLFGDKLTIHKKERAHKAVLKRNKPIGTLIGLTLFVSIAILAGVGVIVMHYLLEPSIPIFLGAFFIIGGCIMLCGVYDFIPVLKDVLVPIMAGSIFLFFPISLIQLVYASNEIALTLKSFFEIFTVYGAAVVFFGWLGLMFVFIGIKTAIDYIRYGEKRSKKK